MSEYSSRLWQMEDGLPHTIVQAIAQTRDGYLWVGTREGLARFDGARFVAFEFPNEIQQPAITSLCESEDGSLWVGTENAGLFRLHQGTPVRYGMAEGLRSRRIMTLRSGGNNNVWIGTRRGVAEWKDGQIRYLEGGNSSAWSMTLDREAALWVVMGREVKSLKGQTLETYIGRNGSLPGSARSVYCDPGGDLWVGTMNGLIHVNDGIATAYRKAAGPAGIVSVIHRDREGNLWIGTYGGLSRFVDGRFRSESGGMDDSYRVYAIFQDREGNLWIGSENGLARLTPRLFKTYTKEHGLTQNTIAAVCAARDGSVWVSTWGGGLNRLKDDTVTVYDQAKGLDTDFMLAVHEGRDGSLWAGADRRGGLNRIKDGRITQYRGAGGPAGRAITAIHEDRDGNLWIGTRDVLSRFTDGRFTSYTTADNLSHNKVNAICEGRRGIVWLGTDEGLTRWEDGRFTNLAAVEPGLKTVILSLYEDAGGTLWIGSKGAGLGRFRQGALGTIESAQGLFSDAIYAILEDDRGYLWLNSSRGIFCVSKRQAEEVAAGRRSSLASYSYGKADGVISSGQYRDVTQPAACRGADGRLWFRTTQGVAVVDPGGIQRNEAPPPVVLEEILSDRRWQMLKPEGADTVIVPPGRGALEFRYTALSFRAPEKNRFKYRLEGLETDWVEAGDRRVAYYNNLAPGHYRFRVIACNNDGVWNASGAAAALFLQPHFWQTWWFLGACGLSAAGLLGGAVRYATRRNLQRKLERLQQEHAIEQERTRIARDLHDDLGARVTQITLLSDLPAGNGGRELLANTRKIAAASREIAQSLDEIVWAVNPQHDTLEGLTEYLSQWADGFLEDTSIRLRLNMPEDIPPIPVPAELRYQLFLAFREALNNMVKHAAATHVEIDSSLEEGRFQIVIADNGTGFEPGPCNNRNGLTNMRQRLKAIGGQCDIVSRPGSGTTVQITVRLNTPHLGG